MTPRGSPPMYFPPSPFALADAVACATLVGVAYDQCQQWIDQDYPSKAQFNWVPQTTPTPYTYSVPFFWSYTVLGIDYDEPFGFIAQAPNGDTMLVLRGTVTDADDIQDARVDQVAYRLAANYGNVHAGFYKIYAALSPQILLAVTGLGGIKRFLFTGHSLGSGLSSLAVPDVTTNTPVKVSGSLSVLHYNFASPRVGDPQFAYAMNNNSVPTYRVVNTEDIVPDAPPSVIGTTLYKHIGIPVDFTAQYGSYDGNHSLANAYDYAVNNPADPEGPLPKTSLVVVSLPSRVGRYAPPRA